MVIFNSYVSLPEGMVVYLILYNEQLSKNNNELINYKLNLVYIIMGNSVFHEKNNGF